MLLIIIEPMIASSRSVVRFYGESVSGHNPTLLRLPIQESDSSGFTGRENRSYRPDVGKAGTTFIYVNWSTFFLVGNERQKLGGSSGSCLLLSSPLLHCVINDESNPKFKYSTFYKNKTIPPIIISVKEEEIPSGLAYAEKRKVRDSFQPLPFHTYYGVLV
jgi:hypothetical protein